MKIISEFRSFIQRGNVLDMAVGVIIGNAFGKIVSSLAADIIMPPIGIVAGGVNLAKMKLRIGEDASGPIYWSYGSFLQTTIDFLIIAFVVFLVVKFANYLRELETKLKLAEPETPQTPAPPSEEVRLLTEIRDTLRAQKGS